MQVWSAPTLSQTPHLPRSSCLLGQLSWHYGTSLHLICILNGLSWFHILSFPHLLPCLFSKSISSSTSLHNRAWDVKFPSPCISENIFNATLSFDQDLEGLGMWRWRHASSRMFVISFFCLLVQLHPDFRIFFVYLVSEILSYCIWCSFSLIHCVRHWMSQFNLVIDVCSVLGKFLVLLLNFSLFFWNFYMLKIFNIILDF